MSDGYIHDLVALMQQMSIEQTQDMELHLIGHVIEYDPTTHMCRVLLPTRRSEDDQGNVDVIETGWVQVGTGHVGDGFGEQYALKGGATAENPEKGEQVQVSIQHRSSGLCAVANLTFNDTMQPPGAGPNGDAGNDQNDNATDDTDGTLQLRAGEHIQKHESGTFIKLYSNGDIGIFAANDAVIRVHGDCKVIVEEGDLSADVQQGDLSVTVDQGDADISVPQGDTTIESDTGSIAVTTNSGDIAVETDEGAIAIYGSTAVEVASDGPIEITSGIVNAGLGPLYQSLANIVFLLQTYNQHSHPALGAPPDLQAVPGIDSTIDLAAS